MLEKWKEVFGALLTDLSKAFDFLDYETLITKLNAYGFSVPGLKFIHDCVFAQLIVIGLK